MLNLLDILISLGGIVLILLCSYFLSKLIQKLFFRNIIANSVPVFWELFLGLFIIVSLYAIMSTKGISILLPVPFIAYYLMKNLAFSKNAVKLPMKNAGYLFGASLLVQFLFFLFTLTYSDQESVKYIAGDFSIYYRMAERLNTIGVEAYNFNINSMSIAPSAYHFGDLWFYAFVARFVSANPSVTFLVSFTILSSIFTLGLYTLAYNLFRLDSRKSGYFVYILILGGLFAGIQICFPTFLRQFAEPYTLAIFNWGKVLVMACALIGLIILIREKNWVLGAFMAFLSCLLYINAAPAIFGAYFLLLALLLFKKEISLALWLKVNLIYIGSTICFILLLYKGAPLLIGQNTDFSNVEHSFLNGASFTKYIKTSVNIFVGGFFQLFTILPFILITLVAAMIVKSEKGYFMRLLSVDYSVLFLLFMFVAGLGSWALLHPLSVDTVQFFHNILAVIYCIGISMLVLYVFYSVTNKVLILITLIVSLFSVYKSVNHIFYAWSFSKPDWVKMEQFFKNDKKSRPFINLKSMNELSYWSAKKTDQYIPLNILTYKWPNYHNISLNTPFIPVTNGSIYANEEQRDLDNATFSTFYKSKNGEKNTLPFIVKQFVKEFDVQYISVSTDTFLPSYLRPMVVDSLILNNSNFILYRFNNL